MGVTSILTALYAASPLTEGKPNGYKSQRAEISRGKVFHLAAPSQNGTDAIQSYTADTDSARPGTYACTTGSVPSGSALASSADSRSAGS